MLSRQRFLHEIAALEKKCKGCLTDDVLLLSTESVVKAHHMQIGSSLFTSVGTLKVVRDIIIGTSSVIYKLTLYYGYTIRLTSDHILCRAVRCPVVASNVHPGTSCICNAICQLLLFWPLYFFFLIFFNPSVKSLVRMFSIAYTLPEAASSYAAEFSRIISSCSMCSILTAC